MSSTKFNPEKDLPPIPFNQKICQSALEMKPLGLMWRPHVGSFVWDPDNNIKQASPFPDRIYFVLSMPRFLENFGNTMKMVEQLVRLPTWHQARDVIADIKGKIGSAYFSLFAFL
jgi:hypothetical protein